MYIIIHSILVKSNKMIPSIHLYISIRPKESKSPRLVVIYTEKNSSTPNH